MFTDKAKEQSKGELLERLVKRCKTDIEPLLNDKQKEWLENYAALQQKKQEAIDNFIQEIEDFNDNKKMSFWNRLLDYFPDISFPSVLRPLTATYGAEEENAPLEVRLEPVTSKERHKYDFPLGEEIRFCCSPRKETYLIIIQEEATSEEGKDSLKFISPDEDSTESPFQRKNFEKLPAMSNMHNLFDFEFDEQGHYYWMIWALPELPWDGESIEKEDLLIAIEELLQEGTLPVVLEINVREKS